MAENFKIGKLSFNKEMITHQTISKGSWVCDAYVANTAEGYKYIFEQEDFVSSQFNNITKKYEVLKTKVWIICFYDGKYYHDFDWSDTVPQAMKKCSLHYEKMLSRSL